MTSYKSHLSDIESRDINALKKKVIELKRMKDELIGDLEREYNKERDFINERETNMLYEEHDLVRLRQQIEAQDEEL